MKPLFILWIFFVAADGSEVERQYGPMPFATCEATRRALVDYDRLAVITGGYQTGCQPWITPSGWLI